MSNTSAAVPVHGHAERTFSGAVYLTGLVVVLPLAPVLGTVVYLTVRRRHPFAARHGLQAAGWQASMLLLALLINIATVILARPLGYADTLQRLGTVGLPGMPALWPQLSIPMRAYMLACWG